MDQVVVDGPSGEPTGDGSRTALGRRALAALAVGHSAVVVGWLVARLFVDRLDSAGQAHVRQGPWTWDGDWYVNIARHGYDALPVESYRFFPVYPALGRLGHSIGIDPKWTLLLINNLAALVAVFLGALWVRSLSAVPSGAAQASTASGAAQTSIDSGVPGERAAWAIALFPAALSLTWAYSEGLMLATTFAFLIAISRRRWWLAAVFGCLAAATRPTGVLLAVVPVVELVAGRFWAASAWFRSVGDGADVDTSSDRSTRARRDSFGLLAASIAPAVGLAGVICWVGLATGDRWLPIDIQRQLRGGFREPISRVATMVGSVASGSGDDLWNLVFLALAVASLWFGRRRLPTAVLLWGAITLVVALSANNVDSLGRYALATPPLVVGWAWAAPSRTWRRSLAIAGYVSTVGFTWLAASGIVVP